MPLMFAKLQTVPWFGKITNPELTKLITGDTFFTFNQKNFDH